MFTCVGLCVARLFFLAAAASSPDPLSTAYVSVSGCVARPNVNSFCCGEKVFCFSDTWTLGSHVSPPSKDPRARTYQPRPSEFSRRSYHVTSTTPALFTATVGKKLSGPFLLSIGPATSSMQLDCDHVLPLSAEYEKRISDLPPRSSAQVAYSRS